MYSKFFNGFGTPRSQSGEESAAKLAIWCPWQRSSNFKCSQRPQACLLVEMPPRLLKSLSVWRVANRKAAEEQSGMKRQLGVGLVLKTGIIGYQSGGTSIPETPIVERVYSMSNADRLVPP